jgi:S-formylglutathione hydrolase FrmB
MVSILLVALNLLVGGHFPLTETAATGAGERSIAHVPGQARPPARSTDGLREETMQSLALGREMRYRVLLPEAYTTSQRRYPVLYLLHGLGGDYTDWTTRTNLAEYVRTLPLIVVMPDGNNQWYTNAADGAARFEDYILTDLQADVVGKFRTINSRYGRSIAGLSMGGYGALKLALKRPGAFAVAASFSGAFNVTRAGELEKLIGAAEARRLETIFGGAESSTRKENDLFALAASVRPAGAPYLYIDIGTADTSLIAANREVVAALHRSGAAYEYHEVAGSHSWDYWDRRIREFLPLLMKRLAN